MAEHIYYKLNFKTTSPLCIGSAVSRDTDKDVMLGGDGRPFIPATTIAGRLRSLCPDAATENELFGQMIPGKGSTKSRVIVYDAFLKDGTPWEKAERDCVALNEYRVAEEGKKFDIQCVQPGCEFAGLIELEQQDSGCAKEVEKLLGALASEECRFGGKANRGFGRAELTVYKKAFDWSDTKQRDAWLDFNPRTGDYGSAPLPLKPASPGRIVITLGLKLKGALSVRVYSTEAASGPDQDNLPDFVPFKIGNDTAMPGTGWAGAFRRRFGELGGEELEKAVFGYVEKRDKKTKAQASRIAFSETILAGGTDVVYTRNAVDRFSGKVKNGALFTEKTHYGGTGELTIVFRTDLKGDSDAWYKLDESKAKRVLAACVADLARGYLAAGGLSSVGRGLFEVTSIGCTDEDLGKTMRKWAGLKEEDAHE